MVRAPEVAPWVPLLRDLETMLCWVFLLWEEFLEEQLLLVVGVGLLPIPELFLTLHFEECMFHLE